MRENLNDNVSRTADVGSAANSAPLVTIGVPFYNPGPLFEGCIKSILAQTYENWELLLVDDGSDDGSVEFAHSIDDPRVRVIVDGERKGLASRLNQIIELSLGDFVARMDADDIMHPERLEKQIKILTTEQNVDGVTTGACYIDLEGNICGVKKGSKPSLDEVFLRGGYLHASLIARKSFLQNVRYDEVLRRAEDRDFFVKCSLKGAQIAVIPDALYYYRWVNNVRWRLWLQSYTEERRIILKYGKKYSKTKTIIWYCRSLLKSMVLMFFVAVGREQVLTKKACSFVNAEELLILQDGLRSVKSKNIKLKRSM